MFDRRQESVLLRLVEAVHFVHEQDGSGAGDKACLGFRQDHAHFRQTGQHGGDGMELGFGVLRQQQGQRGLAATGRPPEDHRMHVAGFDRTP